MSDSGGFRVRLFVAAVALAGAAIGGVIWQGRSSLPPQAGSGVPAEAASTPAPETAAPAFAPGAPSHGGAPAAAPEPAGNPGPAVTGAPARPLVHYRHTAPDVNYGRVAYASSISAGPRFVPGVVCDVVYAGTDRAICLAANRGVFTTYDATVLSLPEWKSVRKFPLDGIPSRSRVSADGKFAAYTVFLTGHGYSSSDFSTQTRILDARTGELLADLEKDFVVERDGREFKATDFNFWGVSFAPDSDRFFATLSTGGHHFLVRGSLEKRTMVVVHDNVECPSVSPDGTRVGYKKRLLDNGRVLWQLHVLVLDGKREIPLSERRSVDDQIEWLDRRRILYSVPGEGSGGGTDLWVVAADGSGQADLYLANAYSPSVRR